VLTTIVINALRYSLKSIMNITLNVNNKLCAECFHYNKINRPPNYDSSNLIIIQFLFEVKIIRRTSMLCNRLNANFPTMKFNRRVLSICFSKLSMASPSFSIWIHRPYRSQFIVLRVISLGWIGKRVGLLCMHQTSVLCI
jgi:hypothetical protein